MPDIVPTVAVTVLGPGPYPVGIRIAEIEDEGLEWHDEAVPFETEYEQTLLLNDASLASLRIQYRHLKAATDFVTLRTFWKAVRGVVGPFPFVHPVTGVQKQMRFAEDGFKYQYDSPSDSYHVTVMLEEALF